MATVAHEMPQTGTRRFEYKVLDTGNRIEDQLNELGAQGWQVVGVTTKKQLFIAPPQAIILMREPKLHRLCESSARESGARDAGANRRPSPPTHVVATTGSGSAGPSRGFSTCTFQRRP